ncbi:carbonic anhydrase-related protein 10 isoform X1 [Vespula maculifrons]|uniref:Carbonic anhydrase-related protein 10 isoform X1 n=1 Tax=Vespula maculifrons TaxID=7453 RepID=A0ABD2AKI3_VESMC
MKYIYFVNREISKSKFPLEINIFERKDGIQNDPIASSIRLTSDAYQPPPQRLLENDRELARRDTAQVSYLSLRSLLPDTNGYMTYEGSTTHPGCWETAVWLILNKPIYITAQEVGSWEVLVELLATRYTLLCLQLYALRKLMQGPASAPKAPLGNNSRPLQDLHHRTIRTNINFRKPMLGETTDPCLTTSFELFVRSRAFDGTPFLFQGGGVDGDEGGNGDGDGDRDEDEDGEGGGRRGGGEGGGGEGGGGGGGEEEGRRRDGEEEGETKRNEHGRDSKFNREKIKTGLTDCTRNRSTTRCSSSSSSSD